VLAVSAICGQLSSLRFRKHERRCDQKPIGEHAEHADRLAKGSVALKSPTNVGFIAAIPRPKL